MVVCTHHVVSTHENKHGITWGHGVLKSLVLFVLAQNCQPKNFFQKEKNVNSELTYLVLEFYISKYLRTILEVNVPRLNHYEDIFSDNFLLLVFSIFLVDRIKVTYSKLQTKTTQQSASQEICMRDHAS